ncbi:MAG: EAL domain-containing protein [Catenulisporales bacterium]|nr:EAL domain-containing protein [Catenulisporales bacterium]
MAVALVILTLAIPSWAVPLRFVAASWAVAAVAVGVVAHDPPHKSAWVTLAGAIVAFQCSDLGHLDRRPLSGDWNEWLSLAGYPLAVVAFSAMVRLRSAGRDAAGLLDAAVGTAALLVPTWVFLVQPYVHDASWTALRLEAILPPIGDVVLLGLLLRLLAAPTARCRSLRLLAAGVVVTAACDVGAGLLQLGTAPWFGTAGGQRLMALGWLSFNLFWGAAALTPDMRGNTEPTPAPKPVVLPARIMALALAALAEPAVAVVLLSQSRYSLGVVGPLVEITIILLIVIRVSLVLADHRGALRRERVLVSATGQLVAAAGTDEIAAVLAATAARLAGLRVRQEIVVVIADGDRFHVASAAGSYQGIESKRSGWRETLSTLAHRTQTAQRAPKLIRTSTLPKALRDALDGFDHALVLPLGTEAWCEDVWAAGVLAAAAPEHALLGLAAPLEILTGQAALSLQRLALGVEIARRDGERYFQALVQNDSDAILIVGTDARIRYASPSAEAMFGAELDDETGGLLGRPVADLIGRVHAGQIADLLADPAPHAPRRRDWVLDVVPGAGSRREVEATISDLRAEPTVNGLVLTLRDVTTARGLERMLQRQAFHDELTDLPNRAAFVRRLDAVRDRAGPDDQVCVVLVDVDRFREINDFHGRDVGDAVLRATAGLLRAGLAPGDVLARVGGDEFAVLRVRRDAEPPRFPVGIPGETDPFYVGPVAVTTSGALVVAGAPGATGADLLADAEITLHAAKETGRSRSWRRYSPELRADLARAAERRAGLDRALAEGAFTLRYQPIVYLADRTLAGFESLIRWPQPDGSVVLPDEFIALAEATGQIVPMGRWVLRTATTRAAAWNRKRAAAQMSPVHVTVNVSAHELRAPTFPDTVAEALAASGLEPERLILEATESSLIDHTDRALANLNAVRDLGVRLALDDFGTGYSSLSYLRDLPVGILKIDKGFTAEVGRHDRQTALVEGIVGIGRALGLSVIAEGIETEYQYRRMCAMGIDLGQGWLFGRPLESEDADELVRTMR